MGSFIQKVLPKVRGILGLGIIGGGVGLVGGTIFYLVAILFTLGFYIDAEYLSFLVGRVATLATPWGLLGAFAGTGFGALLAATDAKRSLDELPLWRMGLFGAFFGTLFMPLFVFVRFGTGPFLNAPLHMLPSYMLPSMGIFGVGGAILSTSMVAMAKKAHRAELAAVEEVAALLNGE